jgi:TRAP-type C4-dicarboxylate transport system permease small subunit
MADNKKKRKGKAAAKGSEPSESSAQGTAEVSAPASDRDVTATATRAEAESGAAPSSTKEVHAAATDGASKVYPSWVEALYRFDGWLTRVETKLLFAVLMAEIVALVVWVALKGFSMPPAEDRGRLMRGGFLALAGAGVGALARWGYGRFGPKSADAAAPPAKALTYAPGALAGLGLVVGYVATGLGAIYTQNILNWVQNASVLFLIGGLRGLVTRLTLWVAMLGASLATGKGKHINIDIVMRVAPEKYRAPLSIVGMLAAIVMCLTGAWGFVDQLAIGEFHAPRTAPCPDNKDKACEVAPGEKVSKIRHELAADLFLLGKQASLDLHTLPVVLSGKPYDQWLTPAEWNRFIDEGGWEKHYEEEGVKRLRVAPDRTEPILPAVIVPGGEENAMGLLVRDLNLVIPMGLFMIALRFILRVIFVVTGRITVDPDAAHSDDDDSHDEPAAAGKVEGSAS